MIQTLFYFLFLFNLRVHYNTNTHEHNDCNHVYISHSLLPDTYLYRNTYTHLLSSLCGTPCRSGILANRPGGFRGLMLLLLLCGDTGALTNPGPRAPRYPCQLCRRAVRWGQRAIQCDRCCEASVHTGWYHVSCVGDFTAAFDGLVGRSLSWICWDCGAPNYSSSLIHSPIHTQNRFSFLDTDPSPLPQLLQSYTTPPSLDRRQTSRHDTDNSSLTQNRQRHITTPDVSTSPIPRYPTHSTPNHSISRSHSQSQSLSITPITASDHSYLSTAHDNSLVKQLSNIRLLIINFRSIIHKRAAFHHTLQTYDPDIVIGTETWLTPDIHDSEIFPADSSFNMTIHRKDREDGNHGGVLIATKPGLVATPASELDANSELIWTKIQIQGCRSLFVGAFYRPPSSNVEYLQTLDESLSKIDPSKNIWLAGDFNLPDVNWTAQATLDNPIHESNIILPDTDRKTLHENFIDIINNHSLTQTVLEPTRTQISVRRNNQNIRHNVTSNILDLFLTNNISLITRTRVLPGLSDHEMVLIDANIKPQIQKQLPRNIYLYNRADMNSITHDLADFRDTFLSSDPTANSVNTNWTRLRDFIHEIMDRHIPKKILSRNRSQPWFNRQLKKLHRNKIKAYNRAKRYKDTLHWDFYKNIQKTFQKEMRQAETKHTATFLTDNKLNHKKFYSFFKSRKQDSTGITTLLHNNSLVTHPQDKATALNTQFQSVFTHEQADLPDMPPSPYTAIPPLVIHTQGIEKLLSELDINKATGPDNIPCRILRAGASALAPVLQVIFSQTLESGEIPLDWLLANVTPIFKSGDRTLPVNYRPVSLTSVPCKILEHIIHRHIMDHFDRHDILTDAQHGFRPKRSCETQLLETTHDISQSLNDSKIRQVDAIVLDFAKAFDKVPHQRLLSKLDFYGIRGPILHWIKTFLTTREQRVVLDGTQSSPISVTSGVPQGTVLGPLLFLSYINDLPLSLTSTTRLFADDSLVYRPIIDRNDCLRLQDDLTALEDWEAKWQMTFRPDKCHHIRFTRSSKPITFTYRLHDTILNTVRSHKYLGVHISADMRWNTHVGSTRARAYGALGFLRRNLSGCNADIKTLAYKTLVRPHLEYCDTVWDPHTHNNINKLEAIQNKAARWIRRDYRHTTSVTLLKQSIKLDPLATRRQIHRQQMLYKITNNLVDINKDTYLHSSNIRSTRGSHNLKYHTYQASTDIFKYSFFPRSIQEWNHLPSHVVNSPTLDTFRNRITNHYINPLNPDPRLLPAP